MNHRPVVKPRSLLSQQLQTLILVMVVFMVTVGVALSIGLSRGLELWKRSQGDSIQEFVRTELVNIHHFDQLHDGEAVEEFLAPFLDPTVYLFVFNDHEELIFWHWKGDSWYFENNRPDRSIAERARERLAERIDNSSLFPRMSPDAPSQDPELFSRLRGQNELRTVEIEGRPVAYFAAGSIGFTITRENKQLVDSLVIAVILGLLLSLLTGITISAVRARQIADGAGSLASALEGVAAGSGPGEFPSSRLRELRSISESASILQERLAEEARLRRQWALDVAHDLRTPLAGLRAQIEGLADGVFSPTEERYRTILGELSRVEDLSAGFLLLTKVESPELTLSLTYCSTDEIAQSLRDRFADRMATAQRELILESKPGSFRCDRSLFDRALSNIVENGIVHGTGGVRVLITSSGVRVRNRGRIPEDEIGFLMDRMYRGNKSRSGSGHGLGLAIASAIANRHGGELAIRNEGDEVWTEIIMGETV